MWKYFVLALMFVPVGNFVYSSYGQYVADSKSTPPAFPYAKHDELTGKYGEITKKLAAAEKPDAAPLIVAVTSGNAQLTGFQSSDIPDAAKAAQEVFGELNEAIQSARLIAESPERQNVGTIPSDFAESHRQFRDSRKIQIDVEAALERYNSGTIDLTTARKALDTYKTKIKKDEFYRRKAGALAAAGVRREHLVRLESLRGSADPKELRDRSVDLELANKALDQLATERRELGIDGEANDESNKLYWSLCEKLAAESILGQALRADVKLTETETSKGVRELFEKFAETRKQARQLPSETSDGFQRLFAAVVSEFCRDFLVGKLPGDTKAKCGEYEVEKDQITVWWLSGHEEILLTKIRGEIPEDEYRAEFDAFGLPIHFRINGDKTKWTVDQLKMPVPPRRGDKLAPTAKDQLAAGYNKALELLDTKALDASRLKLAWDAVAKLKQSDRSSDESRAIYRLQQLNLLSQSSAYRDLFAAKP